MLTSKQIHSKIPYQTLHSMVEEKGSIIQPKLMVNAPNDAYEQEADAVADRVMCKPLVSSKVQGTQGMLASSVQRKCAHCEEEEKKKMPIMRKAESGGGFETSPAFSSQLSNTKGSGQVLPNETKGFMESRFGRDFSQVRVHTDGQAADMNRDIQAKAFTHGSDIYFNRGQFTPNTERGQRLLAHELVHVVQQREEDYNKNVMSDIQRSFGEDLVDTAKRVGNKSWEGTKWVGNKTWDGIAWTGEKAWEGTKWVGGKAWQGTKWLVSVAWEGAKEIASLMEKLAIWGISIIVMSEPVLIAIIEELRQLIQKIPIDLMGQPKFQPPFIVEKYLHVFRYVADWYKENKDIAPDFGKSFFEVCVSIGSERTKSSRNIQP